MTDTASPFACYRNKKVLITGHTGFKGSWLTAWLLELGAEVTGYSKDIPTTPAAFEILGLKKEIRHLTGDVTDDAGLRRAVRDTRPDYVFHLAAQALVRASYREPVETFKTNVMGTVHIMDCLRDADRPVVFVNVTSDKCYENRNWSFGYRETDALGGSDPYSASKGAAEIVFSSYFRSFLSSSPVRAASARAGNVIGGGDYAEDRLVPDCVRAWSEGREVVLRNPGSVRPWQHVLEPLGGYLRLGAALTSAENLPEVNGEGFNFGPERDAFQPVSEVVRELQTHFEGAQAISMPKSKSDAEPHEAKLLKLSIDKAHDVLGWRPTLSFEEAVRWTGQWYGRTRSESAALAELTKSQIQEFSRLSASADAPRPR